MLDTLGLIHEKINIVLQRALKELDIDVHCGHIWLLMLVYEHEGSVELKYLIEQLGKKKTTVSDMVSTLEKKGYLMKQQVQGDKRKYIIRATSKALQEEEKIKKILTSIQQQMFNGLEQNDIAFINNSLIKISCNLD